MNTYARSHPLAFALCVALAMSTLEMIVVLFAPRPVEDYPFTILSYDAARYLLAIGLLASLGWWQQAGFRQQPHLQLLLPFLPWAPIHFTARCNSSLLS